MKVLKVSKKIFQWLGICPIDDQSNHRKKWLYNLFGWLAVGILGSMVLTSLVCAINYATTDLNVALYAAFPGVAAVRLFVSFLSVIGFRKSVSSLFEDLQAFHNQNKTAESRSFFDKANNLSNKITQNFSIYFSIFTGIEYSSFAAMSVLSCYMTRGYVDVDYLFVPYKLALPWNQKTLVGWIFFIVYSVIMASTYLLINATILSFFISIYLNFYAFYKHFIILTKSIDNPAIRIGEQREKIRETIEFDIMAKNLFSTVSKIVDTNILCLIFAAVGLSSISIFQLELAIRNKQLNIFPLFTAILSALSDAFVFCYCGATTTLSFSKYVHRLYEIRWYTLPVNLQKQLIIIMANCQRPVYYRGYGMVTLDLGTFVNILKTVASFYLAFKTFNKN